MKRKVSFSKFYLPIFILLPAAGSVLLWLYGKEINLQISTVVFALVWLDFILSFFTYKRQPALSYILIGTTYFLEIFLIVDLFWVIGRIS